MSEHDCVILLFRPPVDPDEVGSIRVYLNDMPKEIRKFIIGPITGHDGSRCFAALPDCNKGSCYQQKLDELLHKVKQYKTKTDIIRTKFGNNITTIPFSSDKEIIINNEPTIMKLKTLLVRNKALEKELLKLVKWRTQDKIVDEAIDALELVFSYREGLDFLIQNYKQLSSPEVCEKLKNIMDEAQERKMELLDKATPLLLKFES